MIHESLVEASPYGTSFMFAGVAILLLRWADVGEGVGRSATLRAIATVTMCLAFLENISLVLIVGPLFLILFGLSRSRIALQAGLASLVAIAVTRLAMSHEQTSSTDIGGFGASTVALSHYTHVLLGRDGRFVWCMLLLAAVACLIRRRDEDRRASSIVTFALVATLLLSFFATALSDWVVVNFAHPRYLVPDYFLAAGMGGLAVERMIVAISSDGRRFYTSSVAGLAAIFLAIGYAHAHAPGRERDSIVDARWRTLAREVADEATCQHLDGIAGSYWSVWPSVFTTQQRRFAADGPSSEMIFGFTVRGDVMRDVVAARLRSRRQLRIGCIVARSGTCNQSIRATLGNAAETLVVDGAPIGLVDGSRLWIVTISAAVRDQVRSTIAVERK